MSRHLETLLGISAFLGMALVVLLISGVATDDKVRDLAISTCERGNVIRAYLRVDAGQNARRPLERAQRATHILPLLDCSATVDSGRPVLMNNLDAQRFLIKTRSQK